MVLTNAAAERLTGYKRRELLGMPIEMLVPEGERIAHRVFRANYAARPAERPMYSGLSISLLNKEGEDIPVEVALTPVSTQEGDMVMSTLVDLRERLATEKAMRDKNAELDAANRNLTDVNSELSQFTYAVSHDLKAPLASLQGLLSLVAEDLEEKSYETIPESIARAIAICERNSAKVERILSFARGVSEEELEPVNLADLIDEIWDVIEPSAEVPATLVKDIKVGELRLARVSMDVIMQNILSNAVRFYDPEKSGIEVKISVRKKKGQCLIEVEDNGIGIEAVHIGKVFEIFKKIDPRGGDGIGLALVQKHISRLGGTISLTSEPEQGTVVSVSIPLS